MANKGMTSNSFSMELTPKSKQGVLRKFERLEKWLPKVSQDAMILTGEQIATKTDDSLNNAPFIESLGNLRASYHVEAPNYQGDLGKSVPSDLLVGGSERFLKRAEKNEVLVGSPVVYAFWIERGVNRTTGVKRRTTAGINAFINAYIMFKGKLLKTLKNQVSKKMGRV